MPKQMSVLAKPSLSKRIFRLMNAAGSGAPGYRELDGTTYRILDFHGDAEVPQSLRDRFEGAIGEWANDAEFATNLTVYTSREEFGHDFARIDIAFDKL